MLLSYTELRTIADQGIIKDVDVSAINAASIDVRLGEYIMYEYPRGGAEKYPTVDLSAREGLRMGRIKYAINEAITLEPGEFILAHTIESFDLPNDLSAQFMLKSSMARGGLEHANATWCDAGWNNSTLTMELRNVSRYHNLIIRPGMFVGQMKFYRHTPVPIEHSYAARGRYNGDATVSGIKT
jgi:dCTP deaminase